MNKKLFALAAIVFSFTLIAFAENAYQPGKNDVIRPRGLPQIGKWMIAPDLQPAHWLGQKYQGKGLSEPINIIIIDRSAKSIEDAKKRLAANCAAAGFKSRWGHSTGYKGYMDGRLFEQLPEGKRMAFSDRPFELNNNHGRIFGPYFKEGKYYFIGAFSREVVDPNRIKEIHQFGSFNQARDAFAWSMDKRTDIKVARFVELDNAIIGDAGVGTGDHDGIAVLLER